MAKSTIAIVSDVNAITSAIANISTSAAAYKDVASGALVSAVKHYIAHGDYTLVQKALDEMYQVNYRDYKVFTMFVSSISPLGLVFKDDKARKHATVAGTIKDVNGVKKDKESAKQFGDRLKKLDEQLIERRAIFDAFINGQEIQVRNPEWTKDSPESVAKTVGVVYDADVFAWFDDVNYFMKAAKAEKKTNQPMESKAVDAYAKTIVKKLSETSNVPVADLIVAILNQAKAAGVEFSGSRQSQLMASVQALGE